MFKPSDRPHGGQTRIVSAFALTLALAAMLAPKIATAGVSTLEAGPVAASSPKPGPRSTGTWQIRCWQDGRLLFEENGISLPDGGQYSTAITGTDRQGHPVYVAETRNATCLIRQAVADRGAWPR